MLNHIDGIELQDVLDYILKCKDNETLSIISKSIKDKREHNASHLKYSLKVGEKVRVTGTGKFEQGVIIKVNKRKAKMEVYIDGKKCIYTVPFTMITKELSK